MKEPATPDRHPSPHPRAAATATSEPIWPADPNQTATIKPTEKRGADAVIQSPTTVHFAGPPVRAVGRLRQLCMWCGQVLIDTPTSSSPLESVAVWPEGELVRVEHDRLAIEPYERGGELPAGCCAFDAANTTLDVR